MSSPQLQTAATGRNWADEPDRITFTYAKWTIGKNPARPGYIARRTFWDGATVTIEAPDLVILETRLSDDREQERQRMRQPL